MAKLRATADHEVAEKRAGNEREIAKMRTTAEREVAQMRASSKRERDEILTTSKRQADEMRSQAQRILEESEAQRAQAEAEFDIQLAARREEAERQEAERLAAAQAATQKMVSEAEQRAATAEQRASKASAQAEQTRRDADQHSRQLVSNAKKNADQIVAQAKAQADQLLADTKSEADRIRTTAQRQVDELNKQKESVAAHLAQISQLLGDPDAGPRRRAQEARSRRPGRRPRQSRPRPPAATAPQPPPKRLRPGAQGHCPGRAHGAGRAARRSWPTGCTAAGRQRRARQAVGQRQVRQGRRPGMVAGVVTPPATRRRRAPQRGRAPSRLSPGYGLMVWPPSTTRTWPVMYDDASLARNTAGPAISSARPQRCIGTLAIVAGPAAGSSHRLRFRSVAVQPGQSAFTRTPSPPHSTASDFVSEISPALAAPYGDRIGDAATPATEATLITEPEPRSSRWPANAWQT